MRRRRLLGRQTCETWTAARCSQVDFWESWNGLLCTWDLEAALCRFPVTLRSEVLISSLGFQRSALKRSTETRFDLKGIKALVSGDISTTFQTTTNVRVRLCRRRRGYRRSHNQA